jgi:HEPN domain-containing protein
MKFHMGLSFMKDETKNWIAYAGDNLHSAVVLLECGLLNPCLQNIQQSVEKYLKALLLQKDQKIRKTHSISELNTLLQDVGISIGLTEDQCDLFDAVYLPSKYPLGGVLPDFEPDKALCQDCLDIAQKVEEKVKELLIE